MNALAQAVRQQNTNELVKMTTFLSASGIPYTRDENDTVVLYAGTPYQHGFVFHEDLVAHVAKTQRTLSFRESVPALQSGFTLIELLIVVLIIGILATVAIPVFNGQRTKAKNSAALSTLRNAMTAAETVRHSTGGSKLNEYGVGQNSFAGITGNDLRSVESSLEAPPHPRDGGWNAGNTANPKAIFVGGPSGGLNADQDSDNAAGQSGGFRICTVSKGDTIYCAFKGHLMTGPGQWGMSDDQAAYKEAPWKIRKYVGPDSVEAASGSMISAFNNGIDLGE